MDIIKMESSEIAAAYFRANYGDSVSDELIAEVVSELTTDELAAIVATVQDQPHLIER